MRSVAIIPARGGSKRLPRKNILDFLGRPVLHYPVQAAKNSGIFDEIIVSTEDPEISQIAAESGAHVMPRSDSLASDDATVAAVCLDALNQLEAQGRLPDIFCCIYATAVLITPDDLKASRDILAGSDDPNLVMGVSAYDIHPYQALKNERGFLSPMWPEEAMKKSQDWPHFVASNGTIYWAKTEAFREIKDFYGPRLAPYEMPLTHVVDIDTPEDFERAKITARALWAGRS